MSLYLTKITKAWLNYTVAGLKLNNHKHKFSNFDYSEAGESFMLKFEI